MGRRGRPRTYANSGERVKAYRARKKRRLAEQAPQQPPTRSFRFHHTQLLWDPEGNDQPLPRYGREGPVQHYQAIQPAEEYQPTMSTSPLPPNYALHSGHPTTEEYLLLRITSGLSPVTPAQAASSIKGSWYGCYITYTPPIPTPDPNQSSVPVPVPVPAPVGMGRIISDGGWYFHIVDMAVLPDHQRKGLGDVILKDLLARINELAPEGRPYVNLFADPPGRKLYAKNGFVEAAPKEMGMVLK